MTVKFDSTISWGNLMSAVITIVTIVVAFTGAKAFLYEQARRIDTLESVSRERETRLRFLEQSVAGQNADLRNIQLGLGKIEAKLDKIMEERK